MKVPKEKLKDKIIHRVRTLNREQLENIDAYIDQLKEGKNAKHKILSFAGAWKDLDEDTFQDLTENLQANRKK